MSNTRDAEQAATVTGHPVCCLEIRRWPWQDHCKQWRRLGSWPVRRLRGLAAGAGLGLAAPSFDPGDLTLAVGRRSRCCRRQRSLHELLERPGEQRAALWISAAIVLLVRVSLPQFFEGSDGAVPRVGSGRFYPPPDPLERVS